MPLSSIIPGQLQATDGHLRGMLPITVYTLSTMEYKSMANMNINQVQTELCTICSGVMARVYNYNKSADCFCGITGDDTFEFDDCIIEFIKRAVDEKIKTMISD